MTNDEIIELAKQAGFDGHEPGCLSGVSNLDQSLCVDEYPIGETVIEFAELILARAVPDGYVVVPDRRLVSAGGTEKIAGYILTKGGWQDYCLTKMVLKRFAPAAAQKGSV